MVNAAVDFEWDGKFYNEGDKLPEQVVTQLETYNPSLLSNYIEFNARWIKIDSPSIVNWVEKNKSGDRRLARHFNIKPIKEKDKSNMLKVKKQMTTSTFKALNRKQQETELTKLGIQFTDKDREINLIKKYLDHFK